MASKSLREAQIKGVLSRTLDADAGVSVTFAAVTPETDLATLPRLHPWLEDYPLVCKVDECFSGRAEKGYVKIGATFAEVCEWITFLRGREVIVDGRVGKLEHFLVEPFIEHKREMYLAFTCERNSDVILFSDTGGTGVEEREEGVQRICVEPSRKPHLEHLPEEIQPVVGALFALFRALHLSFLEINPLTVVNGTTYLLDAVAHIDTAALDAPTSPFHSMSIQDGFGMTLTEEERTIRALDARSSASLKCTLLNPAGRIWTMIAGGGASIIYCDSIVNTVGAKELANYSEWSGNPTSDEMEAYASAIFRMIEKTAPERDEPRALLIGGGIANFTDIPRTFEGIARALKAFHGRLGNLHLFVRRAGPRDREGLAALKSACEKLHIPCSVHGAEVPMTSIVDDAARQLFSVHC